MRGARNRLFGYGMLVVIAVPLVLMVAVAIIEYRYVRRIVRPAHWTWSLNPTIHPGTWAIIAGIVAFVVGAVAARRWRLTRSERWKTLPWLLVGGWLIGLIVVNVLVADAAWLNSRLDGSPTVRHETRLISTVVRREKTTRSYYVIVHDWRARDAPDLQIFAGGDGAGADLHAKLHDGDPIIVSTRHGFFGIEWVVAVSPVGS